MRDTERLELPLDPFEVLLRFGRKNDGVRSSREVAEPRTFARGVDDLRGQVPNWECLHDAVVLGWLHSTRHDPVRLGS